MSLLQGWLLKRSPQESDVLLKLFDALFEDLYNYASQSLEAKMLLLQCMQIKQVVLRLQHNYVHLYDHFVSDHHLNKLKQVKC